MRGEAGSGSEVTPVSLLWTYSSSSQVDRIKQPPENGCRHRSRHHDWDDRLPSPVYRPLGTTSSAAGSAAVQPISRALAADRKWRVVKSTISWLSRMPTHAVHFRQITQGDGQGRFRGQSASTYRRSAYRVGRHLPHGGHAAIEANRPESPPADCAATAPQPCGGRSTGKGPVGLPAGAI